MNRPWHWMTLALAGALLACALPRPASEARTDSDLSTEVAATLTALAPKIESEATSPVEASATPAPEPTDPAAPPKSSVGRTVVFIDDGNPWLLPQDGEARQVSESGDAIDVLVSDDGQRVVFLRREVGEDEPLPVEVRAVNRDGSGEATLLGPSDFDSLYPLGEMLHNDLSAIDFIPGSHQLLVNTRAIPTGPGLLKYDDLLLLDADSGELTLLFPPGEGGDFLPSPDGQRMAIIRPDSLSLAAIDGSNLLPEVVSYEPVLTYSEYQYYAQPIWSPDSSALAVAIPNRDPLAEDAIGTIWRIAAEGGSAAQLATYEGDFFFAQQFGSSLIAPDFNSVAILRELEATDELLLAPFEGGEPSLYDSGSILWHGWAPGGGSWVYSKDDPLQLRLGQRGAAPTSLVAGSELVWIDSETFLYLSGERGSWTLRLGRLDGSTSDLAAPSGDFISYDFAP